MPKAWGMNSIGKYYPCLFVFKETEQPAKVCSSVGESSRLKQELAASHLLALRCHVPHHYDVPCRHHLPDRYRRRNVKTEVFFFFFLIKWLFCLGLICGKSIKEQ